MKIQFNPNLDYQADAVASIVDIFEGQETCRTSFTVAPLKPEGPLLAAEDQSDLGIGNRLRLLDEEILANVQAIQLRNGLAQSAALSDGMNFSVEMEAGAGKTYVYLRTIFEMYRRKIRLHEIHHCCSVWIRWTPKEYIDFTSRPEIVRLNQAIGEVDEDQYKRLQIRKTIEEHLEKELSTPPNGVSESVLTATIVRDTVRH